MKTTMKTLLLGAMLAVAAGTLVTAAPATDPVIGTWKLNVAKSTFSPGPALKSQTRTYTESADGITLKIATTDATGKQISSTLTFREDGKAYSVTGNPDFDSVSVKRVDALTLHSTQSRGGVAVAAGVRIVSNDGKTLTYAQKGTNAGGVKFSDVLVYDKQ